MIGVENMVVYAQYLIKVEDLEKVVPMEFGQFKEKAEEVLVAIKLQENVNDSFSMQDIFEYCTRDDIEGCSIYNNLESDLFTLLEDRLQETYDLLLLMFVAFKEKTGVSVFSEMNYETDKPYFYLSKDDVVELTPQAKALEQMGIPIELELWEEKW